MFTEETNQDETDIEIKKIDSDWHRARVAMHKEWIDNTKEQIKWYRDGLAETIKHMKQEKEWLAEAIQAQKEFEARKGN